ncbi:MAG: fibronectin type III domain-containing protein, partial [Muribaculaceae bacterium]|nr:fibronectin type III domain-containing protein [Muribaculaceae bacterium]
MRQKLLFTLVALALGAFSSLNAQNNLTVYEGEATSAYVPVYGFYADAFQKIDMVMPAADLSEMEGGTINSITWYLASPAAEAWGGNFQIYMTEVVETTPTTYFDETNATLVYEGPLDGTSEKLSIELATPYNYQGGNLLIAVRQTEEGTYKSATFKGSEVAGAAIQGYSYSSLDAVNLNVRDFLPQTLFEYTPGSGVLYKPKNLQVTNIGTDAATLTWEPGSTETSWNIECKKAADEEWTAVGAATATTYTLEDLTKATLYDVRVQADYGDGNLSGWAPTSFATLACEESDMGEVEYSLTDSYGDGWNAGGKLQICYAGTDIVVQELALPSGNSAEGTFKLCYGVDYDLNWVGGSYLYEVGFVLTGPEGETIYEQTPSSSSEATLAAGTLTTFQIHMNTCPRPTDVVASNVTYNSATISWTPGTDEQDLFEVAYGLPGFDPETATPVQANAATINLTELAENAAYDVYVRSICTADDHSRWSKVYTFTTPLRFPLPVDLEINDITAKSANATWGGDAQAYNFRYRPKTTIDESFEGEELPASWTLNNWVLMPITQYNMGGTPLFAADGESCLASVSINDQTGEAIGVDNWLISPKSDLGGTLEFYVGDLGANYVENFSVYVSTTGTAIADFTPLAENVTTAGSMVSAPEAWAKKEFDLSAYEGQSGYIAIRHHDAAGYYLFVDAVKINGVEGAEWTVLNNVNPPVAMEGLTPGTTYEAQVQGVYEDGNSLWTDVVNFTTLAADAMPENLTITDVTATSATAEWIGSQDTYNLRYRTAAIKNGVNEDFTGYETGAVPTGWTLIDADGDGQNWYVWNLTLDDGTVQTTFSSNSYINNYG